MKRIFILSMALSAWLVSGAPAQDAKTKNEPAKDKKECTKGFTYLGKNLDCWKDAINDLDATQRGAAYTALSAFAKSNLADVAKAFGAAFENERDCFKNAALDQLVDAVGTVLQAVKSDDAFEGASTTGLMASPRADGQYRAASAVIAAQAKKDYIRNLQQIVYAVALNHCDNVQTRVKAVNYLSNSLHASDPYTKGLGNVLVMADCCNMDKCKKQFGLCTPKRPFLESAEQPVNDALAKALVNIICGAGYFSTDSANVASLCCPSPDGAAGKPIISRVAFSACPDEAGVSESGTTDIPHRFDVLLNTAPKNEKMVLTELKTTPTLKLMAMLKSFKLQPSSVDVFLKNRDLNESDTATIKTTLLHLYDFVNTRHRITLSIECGSFCDLKNLGKSLSDESRSPESPLYGFEFGLDVSVSAAKDLGDPIVLGEFFEKKLAGLNVAGRKLSWAQLGSLGKLPGIRQLYLSDTDIDDAGFHSFVDASHGANQNLLLLDLARCSKLTGAGFSALSRLNNLKKIRLMATNIKDGDLEYLTGLPLTDLNLAGTSISDVGVCLLPPGLEWFDGSRTQIGNTGFAMLANQFDKLSYLDLSYDFVGDEGVAAALACGNAFPSMLELYLNGNSNIISFCAHQNLKNALCCGTNRGCLYDVYFTPTVSPVPKSSK